MGFCVGTLSTANGWETKSVENAMNLHFYYWFVSRENQSKLVVKVPSFYALWKRYGEKQDEMLSNTIDTLTLYMKELFDNVKVTADINNLNNTESLYALMINVSVTVSGITYSLAKVVEMRPNNFTLLEKHRLG